MGQFVIDAGQLARLKALARRLYSENRLSADEMRDAAQAIDAIVRVVEQIPIP